MKEILIGFIVIGLMHICIKNEKLESVALYGTKALPLVTSTYLLGAGILGTI